MSDANKTIAVLSDYKLPEWAKEDDLGGRIPSDIRVALRAAYNQGVQDATRPGYVLVPEEPPEAWLESMSRHMLRPTHGPGALTVRDFPAPGLRANMRELALLSHRAMIAEAKKEQA